jgi:hypothetical protein
MRRNLQDVGVAFSHFTFEPLIIGGVSRCADAVEAGWAVGLQWFAVMSCKAGFNSSGSIGFGTGKK